MTKKKTILVLFGGRSPEHDVSIITGIQAAQSLDPALYDVVPLYIAPSGQWYTGDALLKRDSFVFLTTPPKGVIPVALHVGPVPRPRLVEVDAPFFRKPRLIEFDVALLAFHGLIGEDGNMQGLFETANIPYTGMRTMASAILMDKKTTKKVLMDADVPLLPFLEIKRPSHGLLVTVEELQEMLGEVTFPCCLKPAHLGSSIGVACVRSYQEISDSLPAIFKFDDVAILEPFVENLVEYNVAVSRVGGVVRTSAIERPKCSAELLDFKTKYMSGGKTGGPKTGAKTGSGSQGMLSLTRDINPTLPPETERNIRMWAVSVFERVCGNGVPRLDFLCNAKTGEVWFNEANPCPGSFGYFLWEAASTKPVLFTDLLSHLVQEALEKHRSSQIPADPTPEAARLFARK